MPYIGNPTIWICNVGDILIGPAHYEGWTCKECDKLEMLEYPESVDYRCSETHDFINDIYHTPKECPYFKLAIIEHVMEDD